MKNWLATIPRTGSGCRPPRPFRRSMAHETSSLARVIFHRCLTRASSMSNILHKIRSDPFLAQRYHRVSYVFSAGHMARRASAPKGLRGFNPFDTLTLAQGRPGVSTISANIIARRFDGRMVSSRRDSAIAARHEYLFSVMFQSSSLSSWYPIIPCPTGRLFGGTLSQALRARLRSVSSLRDALADISQQHLAKACCELSRRDGAIVAWHAVPGIIRKMGPSQRDD